MNSPYYPDDIQGWQVCHMEGCLGEGHCPRCGQTNYPLLGYHGAIARWAKAWGVTREEAQRRIEHYAEWDAYEEATRPHDEG